MEDIPSWRAFTGQTYDEAKGWGWAKALHPDDLEHTKQAWMKAVTEKSLYEVEYRIQRYDGIYRHFIARGVPIFKPDGSTLEWVGTCIDITERRRAEEALRENEQRLRYHLENSPLAVIEWDSNYVVTTWSVEAEKIFGWEAGETIGKRIDTLKMIYEEDIPIVNRTMERLSGGKERTVISSNRNYTKSGGVVECTWYNSVLLDEKGKMRSVMSLVEDITERKQAEEELHRAAEFRAAAMDRLGEGLYTIDDKGLVSYMNPAAEELFGWSFAELHGKRMHDMTHHHYRDGRPFPIEECVGFQVKTTGRPLKNFEDVFIRKDGTFFDVIYSISPMRDATGKINGLVVVFSDITERKRAENLMQTQLRIAEAVHKGPMSPDEVLRLTLDELEVQTGSKIGFYHFLEKDQETLSLRNWSTNTVSSMCTAEGAGSHYNVSQAGVWVECVRERRPVIHNDYASLPHKKGLPDGHAPVVREMVVPIFRGELIVAIIGVGNKETDYTSADVEVAKLLGDFSWEIVERKRAEEALRRSNSFNQSIIDSSRDCIKILDLDGRLQYMSPGGQELLRIKDMGIYLNVPYEEFWKGTDREAVVEVIHKAQQGQSGSFQGFCPTADGTPKWWDVGISPILGNGGRPELLLAVSRDITERKRAEVELLKLSEDVAARNIELEAANRELDAFSYSVSHDLRAPLRSIDGFSQALIEDYGDKLDDQGRDFLRRVRAGSQRMAQLIDDLLNLSQLTRSTMSHRPVNLSVLARKVADELKEAQPGRKVEFVIADGVMAEGDEKLLQLVLENLLSNAWKFTGKTPEARIEFGKLPIQEETSTSGIDDIVTDLQTKQGEATEPGQSPSDKDRTVYYVRDNGIGFDMTYSGKLGMPFQRLHAVDEFPGTGIGLATVKRIINRHGGRLWVVGEVGKGATASFTLG